MTDDEWRDLADRIASTWPVEHAAADEYRDALDDLDPRAVDAAIDELLIDHRNEAPSPRVVRARAEQVPAAELAGFEPAGWDDDPDAPITAPVPDARPDSDTGPASRPVDDPPAESAKATIALILGVASLFTIPVLVAVIAIAVANQALAEIARTPGLGGERRARVGRGLAVAGIVVFVIVVAVAIVAEVAG